MKLTKLNELKMPTWRWLNMNAAEMDIGVELDRAYPGGALSGAEGIVVRQGAELPEIPDLPGDMERLKDFVFAHHNYGLTITIPEGVQCGAPIVLDLPLNESAPVLLDFLDIRAEAGSRADVVVRYSASGGGGYFHGGFAAVTAKAGAQVRLIKIQMLGNGDGHLDGAAIRAEEGGSGSALFCELGGKQVVSGCNLSLAGAGSRGQIDALYLGSGERRQDFNYRLELQGPGTEGEISVKGALAGKSRKVLKSTLDFLRGASGAKGTEEETVLTLSDRVVNLSTPLLLCGEADVEGAHATSSGRPDPGKLYYLMSRGFTEKEAKQLLVEASFTPVLHKLPSFALREGVHARIREVVHREG